MNNNFKLVYSEALNTWVAVAEHVSARGKKSAVRLVTAAALLAGGAVGTGWALAAPPLITSPAVNQLPTGGQVAAGTVNISQTQTAAAASMLVQQSSNRAIVNWQSFNVGANAKVNITQPSSSSVLLNRVLDSNPSQIFGQVNANGQVFLTNPNGVYFAPGSSVDVGSFTASTNSITDSDFLAGKYNFNRNGATGSILNEGTLSAGLAGYIALLAPEVRNQGVVLAQVGGTVVMASGESYQLQFNSNNRLTNVLATPSTINTLIENGNAVQAPGGLIILSAQAASSLLGGVVKNSGSISATGLENDGGTIRLSASNKIELTSTSRISSDAAPNSAGNGGRIDIIADLNNATSTAQVEGTILAKGGELGGDGGLIETSAAKLKIADSVRVSTLAARGQAGEWLLDPTDFNISATGGDITGAALTTNLASGNVTITSTSGASGTAGNINVLDAVSWSSNTLTLNSGYNINVGSTSATGSLTVTGSGSLNLNPSASTVTGWTSGGAVLMGMAASPTSGLTGGYLSAGSFGAGAATGFNGQINVSTSGTVKISNTTYSVINSEADFVGIASGGNYVVGSQLGFSTVYTAAVVASFGGKLNGFGHVISGLDINNASASGYIGLFASSNGHVSNLGLSGSIVGPSWVGAIAGYTNGLVISRSYSTVAVTGAGGVGGLVGLAQPVTISESYSTGDVTGNTSNGGSMGGLVGFLYGGTITSSYATGAIRGVSGSGGLVGSMQNNSHITNSFATGDVIATQSNKDSFGGLVGYVPNGDNKTITKSYATGAVRNNTGVTGTTYKGGLIGNLGTGTNVNIADNYWNATANPSFNVSTGGTGIGAVNSGISALTTSQMKSASSFSSAFGNTTGSFTAASGWGFQSGVNGGFPVLCAISYCTSYDSSLVALTYNGASNGLWSLASNWLISGTSTASSFAPTSAYSSAVSGVNVNSGAIVNYDTASVGSLSIPIANAGTIHFTDDSNVSITSVISGTGALTKAGTGTLTLSGTNTYSGGTTISAGTLQIGAGGTSGRITGNVSNSGVLDFNLSSDITFSGLISGSGSVKHSGTGTTTLSRSNTYSGGTTITAGTVARGADTPFGTGTITVNGGAVDVRGAGISNNFILGAGGSRGALTSSTVGEVYLTGNVSLTANSSIGGDVASNVVFFGPFTSNGYGLVLLDRITKLFWNANNTLTTIATGANAGGIGISNNQAMTIGQVVLGGTTYSGISSTSSVSVYTRTGDLTVSQNVATTSTSNNGNAPALDLRAGTLTTAGNVTGGDLVLSGNPTFSIGANALAVFYTGSSNTAAATALINNLSTNTSFNKVYNIDSNTNIYNSGYWAAFRGSQPVTIYLLPVSGQSGTYGTSPTSLNYCYSSSASSCVNVSYSGIPSTPQSFLLSSGALSSTVNVSSGVSGTLALTGSPSIASSGLVATTNAGTYGLTLTPSLTLAGYTFSAGNSVNYTVNRKPVAVTNASRSTTYNGISNYTSLATGTTYSVGTMVGSDAVASVTQTPTGFSGNASGVAQAGAYTVTPSAAVLSTGNASNYNFSYVPSTHTVNKVALNIAIHKTYNGTSSFSSDNTYTLSGMVSSQSAPTISSGSATTNSANANSYNSFATNSLVLSNSNYTLTGGTVTATIAPKSVSISNTSRSTTYDGVTNYSTLASGASYTVGAMVGSDTVASVTQTPSGLSESASGTAQAGSFTVTPSAAVMGTGTASNYSFSYVASTHTVDKANLSVSATPSLTGNVYNGSAFTGTYTTTAVNGETFTVTGQATGTNAGTYTSALNVSGAALANYNTPVITNANLVISPKPVTVTNTDRSTTYDGVSTYASLASGTSFTTSTMVGNDAVGLLTQTPSTNGAANTGTFTVTPSAAALSTGMASNYDFTYVPSTHTVNKAALTLTASTNTKNFDGKTDAQAIPTVSGLKGSDTVSNLSEAYSDVNPGTGKTLTVQAGYQISDGNQGRNYTVTLVPDQTGEIRALVAAVIPPEAPSASTNSYVQPTLTLFEASTSAAPNSSASSANSIASSNVSVGSSSGVVVNTISSPTTQVNGLVAVLVPSGTATAGTGLVIALPEQVLTSNAAISSVQVTLPNNEPLPSWIRYNAANQTLVTTAVPTGAFPLSVVVTVGGQSTIIQISESKTNP